MYASGLLPGEECRECLIDDLGDGLPIQVRLPADGLDPALLDVEGDALGLTIALGRGGEGLLPALPPVQEFGESGNLRLAECAWVDIGWTLGTGAPTGQAQGFDPVTEGAFRDAGTMGDLALGETFLFV